MSNLYLISTPIGNLEDLSLRAIKTIAMSEVILCEDTRRTGKLIEYINNNTDYTAHPRLVRFDDNLENRNLDKFISIIKENKNVCLVSDSGTPIISDPGFKLVRELIKQHSDIVITTIPGASAINSSLLLSGFEPDSFMFVGFLPRKDSKRSALFNECKQIDNIKKTTFISYESPYRIIRSVLVLEKEFGDNVEVVVARELTKMYEEVVRGTPSKVIKELKTPKGEITMLFRFRNED